MLRTSNLNQHHLDTASNLVLGLIGITLEKMARFHDDPDIALFSINSGLYENTRAALPAIKLYAGPGKHTIGGDVKFPGFITNVRGMATFADTSLTGPVILWNSSKNGTPFVPYKSLRVLNDGGTLSEDAVITLSYNPMLGMNFYHDVSIDQLDKPDTLLIEKWEDGKLIYSNIK